MFQNRTSVRTSACANMPRAAGFFIRHRTFSASPAPAPDDNAAETIGKCLL